jgi:hypothetical protein
MMLDCGHVLITVELSYNVVYAAKRQGIGGALTV